MTAAEGDYPTPEADYRWKPGFADDDWDMPKESSRRDGYVRVWREVHSYNTDLAAFIEHMNRLAVGLEDSTVELVADCDTAVVYIVGERPMTGYDRERLAAVEQRRQDAERAEFEALKAKYEPPPAPHDP